MFTCCLYTAFANVAVRGERYCSTQNNIVRGSLQLSEFVNNYTRLA